ncbi:sulfur carrier protein ThiS [Barrientosiimonas endolithica]|uniref:Thiamine biosynthesis protein ThiS n=1 Tax=Barrientosiimonas endolithica TaxID=1535208 RepID=A0ABM8HGJ0_9MICO|nr:sulfur carrier protein ThiS [Barrientosiimonas endolithica]BDZ60139.1 thiamine biosynthesis protein ThiS [Barrientosiimonas endolithica]
MIDIQLNGAPTRVEEGAAVVDLVADLTGRDIRPDGTAADGVALGLAVAVNTAVVPRSRWSEARLAAGDEVEVLTAVQGG